MVAKITIAYDGAMFFGSQALNEDGVATHKTVASTIEELFEGMGINSKITFAGRTDRGVHALRQTISFEVPSYWQDATRLHKELVKKLPAYIEIKNVEILENFNARFNAKKRTYRYIISTKKPSVFDYNYCEFCDNIDLDLMRSSIKQFVGTHDFRNFSKRGSNEKSTIRTIYSATIYKHLDLIVIKFVANSFLRGQVRLMVGALIEIGSKNKQLDLIAKQLKGEKISFKNSAKAGGLYLAKVDY